MLLLDRTSSGRPTQRCRSRERIGPIAVPVETRGLLRRISSSDRRRRQRLSADRIRTTPALICHASHRVGLPMVSRASTRDERASRVREAAALHNRHVMGALLYPRRSGPARRRRRVRRDARPHRTLAQYIAAGRRDVVSAGGLGINGMRLERCVVPKLPCLTAETLRRKVVWSKSFLYFAAGALGR